LCCCTTAVAARAVPHGAHSPPRGHDTHTPEVTARPPPPRTDARCSAATSSSLPRPRHPQQPAPAARRPCSHPAATPRTHTTRSTRMSTRMPSRCLQSGTVCGAGPAHPWRRPPSPSRPPMQHRRHASHCHPPTAQQCETASCSTHHQHRAATPS
jgi:hypothetical protein